jgi:hypothetical protein
VQQFEVHFDGCLACRQAIDETGWIDGLLRSPERIALESPRPALVVEVESAFARSRQRAGLLTYGLAAAAAVLLAVGWIVFADHEREKVVSTDVIELNELPKPVSDSRTSDENEQVLAGNTPPVIVDGGADMLVVPIESPFPDVTIVRMYPIYKPDLGENSSATTSADDVLIWPESL